MGQKSESSESEVGQFDDLESFEDFFRRLLPKALGMGQRITGSHEEAEDVAVEAFARAYARWSRVSKLPWKDGWVLRVASREALRRVGRHSVPSGEVDQVVEDESASVVDRELLVPALAHLSKRQRQVIVLRYLGDLPERDVAQALGVSQGAVKTHLHRGLAALRAQLGPTLLEGGTS